MLATIDLPIAVHMRSPLHVGTGCARALLDRTVVRDRNGNVYLPGSALKGRVRDACERLAKHYNIEVCNAPNATHMCRIGNPCLVCRLFGGPGRESGLVIDNGHLSQEWAEMTNRGFGQMESRTQVEISRSRGVASEGWLFTSEFAVEGLVFHGAISGQLELTPVVEDTRLYCELLLLLGGLRLVECLGGGNSRGIGTCRIELPDVFTIDSREEGPLQFAVGEMLEHLEFLECYIDPN